MEDYKKIEVPKDIKNPAIFQLNHAMQEITKYDYVGVKIAMGVATIEEYAEEIAYTESIRQVIRELEEELKTI